MTKEKIKIGIPVIVEGKYDKIRLSNIIDANIITTDGFGIFNNKEKQALVRILCKNGVILLTDSDKAGGFIRQVISGYISKDLIYNLYTPQIEGKEKRKSEKSKDGLLGVEGINDEILYSIFLEFVSTHGSMGETKSGSPITKADMYSTGLSGHDDSKLKRAKFCQKLGLPEDMTTNALLSALNTLYSREDFYAFFEQ